MKVALICPDDLSAVLYCRGLIKALRSDEQMDIYLISSPMANYQAEVRALGANYLPIPMERFLSPLQDLRYFYALCRLFRQIRPEVVVAWTTKCNIFSALAARQAQARKVIFSVRGLGAAFQEDASLKARVLNALVLSLYRVACRAADRVWFINQDNLNFFLSRRLITPRQAIMTTNGINTELYSPTVVTEKRLAELRRELGLAPRSRVVVMVGRMIWPKGIREFIEAARILQERLSDVQFLLVGPLEKGSPNTVPEQYLRESESSNLRWLGFRKDVKDLYALADLAVLPSYYKEGIPRGLLEPMALGKPVVATNTAECRIMVEPGRNGYLVPPRDSRALAQAIERLITDEAKCREYGRYSRMKIEREFNEKSVVAQIIAEISSAP